MEFSDQPHADAVQPPVHAGRRMLFAGAVLLSGCIPPAAEQGTETTDLPSTSWSAEPTNEILVDGYLPIECVPRSDTVDLLSFSEHQFFTELNGEHSYQSANALREEFPDATPIEFMEHYLERRLSEIGETFNLSLDENVIDAEWELWEFQDRDPSTLQQNSITKNLDTIIDALQFYPPGTLEAFDIVTIRIGNQYDNGVAGHYDSSKGEILFEYDQANIDRGKIDAARNTLGHEIAHAMHDKWCDGFGHYDSFFHNFTDTAPYAGNADPNASDEVRAAHYDKVPAEQYTYGPDRAFATLYGATNASEDFATIVAYTIESRGLIREGDADYDSILHAKQQEVVKRIEQMMPGFEDFIIEQTKMLRLDSTNEVHLFADTANKNQTIEIEQVLALHEALEEGQTLHLNGIHFQDWTASTRGGFAQLAPEVRYLNERLIVSTKGSEEISFSAVLELDTKDPDDEQLVVQLLVPKGAPLFVVRDVSETSGDWFEPQVDNPYSSWTGDLAFIEALEEKNVEDFEFVTVTVTL